MEGRETTFTEHLLHATNCACLCARHLIFFIESSKQPWKVGIISYAGGNRDVEMT